MKTKVLPITDVKIEKEVYPRMNVDWVTTARYYNALKSGAKFPPITVASYEGRYVLVDGAHRLKAFKDNKEDYIQAEILEGLDKKQIYLKAVEMNVGHGRQFSTVEVTNICLTLEKWNMNNQEISEIIRIPADKIEPFVAKRITRINQTNEDIALKKTLRNLSGMNLDEEPDQTIFSGGSQVLLIDNLIRLFQNNWMDLKNPAVYDKLVKLYEILRKKVELEIKT